MDMNQRNITASGAALLTLICGLAAAGQLTDARGVRDPALFSRLPHYVLPNPTSVDDKQYDFHEFTVKEKDRVVKQRVEGHKTIYRYNWGGRVEDTKASPLQIMRNYQNAATKIGGQVLYEDDQRTTLHLANAGRDIWVEVFTANQGYDYYLYIVERGAMKQDVIANAQALQAGLTRNGHVEVPGIYFDFGKAEVKPESEAALKEVVKLLQANGALKLWVVGHTDSVGSVASNLALSNARAAAVVRTLVRMGVNPARLASFGAGPYAPVMPNATDEGRAHNRRVELVSQ